MQLILLSSLACRNPLPLDHGTIEVPPGEEPGDDTGTPACPSAELNIGLMDLPSGGGRDSPATMELIFEPASEHVYMAIDLEDPTDIFSEEGFLGHLLLVQVWRTDLDDFGDESHTPVTDVVVAAKPGEGWHYMLWGQDVPWEDACDADHLEVVQTWLRVWEHDDRLWFDWQAASDETPVGPVELRAWSVEEDSPDALVTFRGWREDNQLVDLAELAREELL